MQILKFPVFILLTVDLYFWHNFIDDRLTKAINRPDPVWTNFASGKNAVYARTFSNI
ncbi:MAG: hypothetical protein ACJA2O_002787 [Candidatus Azotimanducaceae bacterium]|jgi:hypothetical protein